MAIRRIEAGTDGRRQLPLAERQAIDLATDAYLAAWDAAQAAGKSVEETAAAANAAARKIRPVTRPNV